MGRAAPRYAAARPPRGEGQPEKEQLLHEPREEPSAPCPQGLGGKGNRTVRLAAARAVRTQGPAHILLLRSQRSKQTPRWLPARPAPLHVPEPAGTSCTRRHRHGGRTDRRTLAVRRVGPAAGEASGKRLCSATINRGAANNGPCWGCDPSGEAASIAGPPRAQVPPRCWPPCLRWPQSAQGRGHPLPVGLPTRPGRCCEAAPRGHRRPRDGAEALAPDPPQWAGDAGSRLQEQSPLVRAGNVQSRASSQRRGRVLYRRFRG